MANILITGANRGIGLELARHFVDSGHHVFATCRDQSNAESLNNLASGGRLTVFEVEVKDDASVAALKHALADDTLESTGQS